MILVIFVVIASTLLLTHSISAPLDEVRQALERVAAGQLTVRVNHRSKDEIGQLAIALNGSLESIATTLAAVQRISDDVSAAATQLAASASHISGGAQEQAASLEETAASLEEVNATVKQNTRGAQDAAHLASTARDTADRGGTVVSSAVTAMVEISKSTNKIADIITTIDEIAFQTNLLALNAAVEAARAGEQGRGFGVVASEIRNLAQRSAAAAKEIRRLIAASSSAVELGTRQVNQSGETLGEIVKSVRLVTDMIGNIANASAEQASAMEQVSVAVTQVDQVTQGNATQTEELSQTADSLSTKANELRMEVAKFEVGDGRRSAARQARAIPPKLPASKSRIAA